MTHLIHNDKIKIKYHIKLSYLVFSNKTYLNLKLQKKICQIKKYLLFSEDDEILKSIKTKLAKEML